MVPENVYDVDETGVLTSALGFLKVLINKEDIVNFKGNVINRTLVTAIKCISADGRCLFPLIVCLPVYIGVLGPCTQLLDGTLHRMSRKLI